MERSHVWVVDCPCPGLGLVIKPKAEVRDAEGMQLDMFGQREEEDHEESREHLQDAEVR